MFCGKELEWDYKDKTVGVDMKVYVNANLTLRLATVDALAVFSPSLSYI